MTLLLRSTASRAPTGCRTPGWPTLSAAIIWLFLGYLASGCVPAGTPIPRPPPPTATVYSTVPFPTAAPTITETPPPSLTPTPDLQQSFGRLLYSTEFDSAQGWPVGSDPFGVTSLDDDQLSVVVNQPNALRAVVAPLDPLSDFYAEASLNTALCQSEDEFGLIFRINPLNEQYRFTITCDGGLRLRRVLVDSSRAIVPFEPVDESVMPHAPAHNRLGVLARGADFELFVNGVSVLKAHDAALPTGRLGLVVSSAKGGQTTVSFDSFSVWSLRQPTPQPTNTPEAAGG